MGVAACPLSHRAPLRRGHLHWQPFAGDGHVLGDPAGDLVVQDLGVTVDPGHGHDDGHAGAHQVQLLVLGTGDGGRRIS